MTAFIHKIIPFFILIIASAIGYVSYLFFLIFLYKGPLDWVRLNFSESGSLLFNGMLCLAFFIQHSGMIRRSFRKKLSGFIPSQYQGATYTLASGLALAACVCFWQSTGKIVIEANGLFRIIMRAAYVLAILGMFWGVVSLRLIDMFGLNPIIKHINDAPVQESDFIIQGPYRWVRHPLYLFMIVLFWSCPVLTTDRLLFNSVWTLWVVAATVLEERDLVGDFGNAYRVYQAKVPMLLPWKLRPSYPE